MTNKITDITPESIKIIPAREKVLASIEAEQLGATVGSIGDRLVSDVNKAIEAGGTVNTSVLNGTISLTNLNIASMGWTQTCSFSVTDLDTVSWGAGVFTSSTGTSYNIGAGNTGNMGARTYIYLDTSVSTTAYQVTTTATTAVGAGKVLIGTAVNGASEATFEIFGGVGGAHWAGNTIVANSITANQLATSLLYAGALTIDTGGHIKCGMTDYLTGTGFFEGFSSGVPKWSVGNSAGDYAAFDGSVFIYNGSRLTFESIFGDGSDGDVTINADTSLSSDMYYDNLTVNSGKALTCNGYRIFVKGTLTNNGTIKADGGNGGNGVAGSAGGNGSGGSAGAVSGVGSILSGVAGVAGVNGNSGTGGNDGLDAIKGLCSNGTLGGEGGNAGGGAKSQPGTIGHITGTIYNNIKNFTSAYNLFDIFPGSVILPFYTSAGGSSGGEGLGGNNSGGSGGSGASGGIVWISAKTIINNAGAYIQANGGNGGNGGNSWNSAGVNFSGAGGGGAGGGGGVIIISYSSLINSGTIQAAGGTGGTKGLGYRDGSLYPTFDGTDGSNGNAGTIIYLKQ